RELTRLACNIRSARVRRQNSIHRVTQSTKSGWVAVLRQRERIRRSSRRQRQVEARLIQELEVVGCGQPSWRKGDVVVDLPVDNVSVAGDVQPDVTCPVLGRITCTGW